MIHGRRNIFIAGFNHAANNNGTVLRRGNVTLNAAAHNFPIDDGISIVNFGRRQTDALHNTGPRRAMPERHTT